MTGPEKKQLLENIFGGDELNSLREASLARGSKEMRRRRHRVWMGRIVVTALPVVLLAVLITHPWIQPLRPAPAPIGAAHAANVEHKVEYITADQLFALFPNRPMALVGKPGQQRLIFLDNQPGPENQ
ncbi:MAG TPA: hypothetical protein VFC44_20170 [Candidatus Saccharimonadales bacterium]|nr:hypothetical protein [Candidatus Saccharimonadales bacterium]